MNKKKALEAAREWLYPELLYRVYDCCDSMHDSEKLESRFDAFVEDTISIVDFVKQNLYEEYLKQCIDIIKEYSGDDADVLEELNDTPSKLPIPFEEIKNDLVKLLEKE